MISRHFFCLMFIVDLVNEIIHHKEKSEGKERKTKKKERKKRLLMFICPRHEEREKLKKINDRMENSEVMFFQNKKTR